MHVTTICSYKGGTGKTTTAFNLACNLAAQGKKVLAIDTDPQGDFSYLNQKRLPNYYLYDLFHGTSIKKCIYASKFKNLYLLSSSSQTEEINCKDSFIIKKALEEVQDIYDEVIIDCHPSMQIGTINAVCASNQVIITFKPNRLERNGLEIIDSYLSQLKNMNEKLRDFHLLVTLYANRSSQKRIISDVVYKTTYPIFETAISLDEACNTSLESRKPLYLHRKKSRATLDYALLTKEIIENRGR